MWGAQTRSYARIVKSIPENKYDEIVRLSKAFVSVHQGRSSTNTTNSTDAMQTSDDENDERAALGEGSDTDSDELECKDMNNNTFNTTSLTHLLQCRSLRRCASAAGFGLLINHLHKSISTPSPFL